MNRINKKVILLEDNKDLSQQTKKLLETIFLNPVRVYSSVDEALEGFMENLPDLIVCDIQVIGDQNGLDFIEKAKILKSNVKSLII